jgi:diadenosine tetraphosphate (Ap4A) HIT family hydrolase
VAETPDEFYARVIAAADADGRLPLPDMTGWEAVFPFVMDGLRVAALHPPAPEPAREGTDGTCRTCDHPRPPVWSDERWTLTVPSAASGVFVMILEARRHVDFADLDDDLASELGRLSVHLARAIEALPHVARAHVYRIGDGGEHLHIWFFARPAEQLQLRGSYLVSWDDILPPLPEKSRRADADAVARALAASFGGSVPE